MTSYDLQRQERYNDATSKYTIMLITDEDKDSQVTLEDGKTYFMSHLRYVRVRRDGNGHYTFDPVPEDEGGEEHVHSKFGEVDKDTFRGGEFSELVKWGRHMMAFDDRTGIVGEIRGRDHTIIPRQILMTGSGDEAQKGFKCEWATLKGDNLIVGSHGKVRQEEWIKIISAEGFGVRSVDWSDEYRRMRDACGVDDNGYVVHEAADWDPYERRWLFFPRKISFEPFHEPTDERQKGNNMLIIADETFENIRTIEVGERIPERGPSSLKLVPGRSNEFLCMKSVEIDGVNESWIGAATVDGKMLAEERKIGDFKCEGIEIT